MKKLGGYLFICFLVAACNGHVTPGTALRSADTTTDLNWYKRYTGTIGSEQVIINLHQSVTPFSFDSTVVVKGNYYVNGDKPIELLENGRRGDTLILTEEVVLDRNYASTDTTTPKVNKWLVVIKQNTIHGKWISANGDKQYNIDLHEDYTNALPFTLLKRIDSSGFKGRHFIVREIADYLLCQPVESDKANADFITSLLLKELEGDSIGAATITAYIQKALERNFTYYQKTMTSLDNDSVSSAYAETNNWDINIEMLPVYNDNGLVVFGKTWYEYTGGAHGNHGTTYICADVQQKRALHLADIFADTTQLSIMLEEDVRKRFSLTTTQKLNTVLLVDRVPVTGNIAIGNKGLIFHYNPYEIAAYAMGDIELFVSYNKLEGLLKESFKARIQL